MSVCFSSVAVFAFYNLKEYITCTVFFYIEKI